ncbi:nitrate- and nitrite sensing domain-containing protein [Streptomyces sp. NPDC047002]|uniref:sensor histidine kinase n=1 Tax=Streptomyces sp. NPDC047002 TaxID=3155475 RepID=UPI003454060E
MSRRSDTTNLSLRAALLILAFVPGVALTALWAVTSGQTYAQFRHEQAHSRLVQRTGLPAVAVYADLQAERALSAGALAGDPGAAGALDTQRARTDAAVAAFAAPAAAGAAGVPGEMRDAVAKERQALRQLPAQRALVDRGSAEDQASVYRSYTNLITVDLHLFTALSHADDSRVNSVAQPLMDLFWAEEMRARSDALLARGWRKRALAPDTVQQVRDAVAQESFELDVKVLPYLPDDERDAWDALLAGKDWQAKTAVEQSLLVPAAAGPDGLLPLTADGASWRRSMDALTPRIGELVRLRTADVVATGDDTVRTLLWRMVLTSAVGLAAVVAVVLTTWRLTRSLRRRIGALQERAEELERTLPDVVERLAQGEAIDVDAAADAGPVHGAQSAEGGDELARLGRALNLARASALGAAVRQAELHRGFELLLQRIARRTQRLIGQQLRKLDELERRHDDPEVLEGLFDLDHLTARLRRYEENLVIMSGGSPHRRWRRPVPLLDVLRSAQGEVRDYRRVVLDPGDGGWLAARAVGPLGHVLAELIDNGLAFSRPPRPVEVRAGRVGRGVVIEVADHGLGMDEDQRAEANELMLSPPRPDVLARAEDVRLGLQVVARLAGQYGLRVEFLPSASGGTRAVVFVPDELTAAPPPPPAAGPPPPPDPADLLPPAGPCPPPAGGEGAYASDDTYASGGAAPEDAPLPRRVRQAALADGLRSAPGGGPAVDPQPLPSARRAGAAIGAFQRQSRARRAAQQPPHVPAPLDTREDRP